MSIPPREYGCWPDESQRLLLRAALCGGDEARSASSAWWRQADLDRLDAGSMRLLPLLHRAMTDRGEVSPETRRLRGIYRQTWYRNSLLIGRLAGLIRTLEAEGIPTLVLKGVPLSLGYYKNTALRPMSDADLLVPTARAREVLPIVRAAGWAPRNERDTWPPRFTASRSFAGPLGLDLDLHWHVLHESLGDADDAAFWEAAQPIEVGGVASRMLCPADQLLHIVAHGFRRNTVPPVRWLADATFVIRETPDFDWPRVVSQARARQLARIAARSLALLKDLLDLPVPEGTLAALESAPHSLAERVECWGREQPGLLRLAAEKWSEFQRSAGREPQWTGPLGFPRFVRDQLGLTLWRQMPAEVWVRLARRRAAQP